MLPAFKLITLAHFAGQPDSGAYDHLLQRQRDDIFAYIKQQQLDHPVIAGFRFGGGLGLECQMEEFLKKSTHL